MAFLVVASIVVPVMEDTAVERIVRIGSSNRAFAGGLRSTVRAEKREWTVSTGLLTNTETTTLKAAVDLAEQVTCSGDCLGGSVTCEVEVGDGAYVSVATTDGTGVMRSLVLTLRQV
jgi:hypothetical protein